MSDSNFLKYISQSAKVPADIVKAVVEPPAQQIGKSLADLLYVTFSPLTKKRAQIEQNIEIFKNEIGTEIAKIDPEKIVEPKLSVAGPILDSAKFYVEEKELRHMFAKLIAASVNEDFKDSALPAFVELIRALSSFDAQNLLYLKSVSEFEKHRVAGKIGLLESLGGDGQILLENFIPFQDLNKENISFYSASIDNLVRLGIIQFHHGYTYTKLEVYEKLFEHKLTIELQDDLTEMQETDDFYKDYILEISKGSWKFTDFGKFFIKTCL